MSFLENVSIRELFIQDREIETTALALLNRTQGNGLFSADYLQKRFRSGEGFVVAAFLQDEFIGVSVAEIIHSFDYYHPFDPNLSQELSNKIVGSFATLSVVEHHQGKGVGQLLSHQRLKWLMDRKCHVALGVSWVSGLSHTSNRTFERVGFRAIKRLQDFYHASSIEKPFDCPGCHKIPCICEAILYRRDFSQSH